MKRKEVPAESTAESKEKKAKLAPTWREDLKSEGFAVVKGCVSTAQVDKLVSAYWDWLEGFKSGLDRNDSKTWRPKNSPPSIHGILQQLRIGHQQFVWDARMSKQVCDVFSEIWKVPAEDLLVSFDGAYFSGPSVRPETAWPHLDQGPSLSGFQCVQGLLNLQPCGPNNGGLVVWRKSHLKVRRIPIEPIS